MTSITADSNISLYNLGFNIFNIGTDAETSIYWTRVSLLIPVLQQTFDYDPEIESIIDTLINISAHSSQPFFRYLIRSVELIETVEDTKNVPINFLAQSQIDFIINNLEKFKEVVRYLIIGNRQIEKIIDDDLYESAAEENLFIFREIFSEHHKKNLPEAT